MQKPIIQNKSKAAPVAPRHATQAIVAKIPQKRAIIPQTKPPVAVPFCSGFFFPIAPKTIARIPQIVQKEQEKILVHQYQ